MGGVARDPALELLREQRGRLAERLRPPWWYLAGIAVMYALVFTFPFTQRYLGLNIWPILVAGLVVAVPLQWGWTRVTGMKMGFRNLSHTDAGRPVRIALVVVSLGTVMIVHFLLDSGLIAVAVAVVALAVAAEVALQQDALRLLRQELRGGGGAA
jgi:hypothetical protein